MLLMILATAMLVGAAFVALQVVGTRSRQIDEQLARASSFSVRSNADQEQATKSFAERVLAPMGKKFSNFGMKLSPQSNRMILTQRLHQAGVSISPQNFLAFKGGLTIGGIILGLFFALVAKQAALMPLGFGISAIGFIGPDFVINKKAAARKFEMERMLPDTLDLLTVSVEAGLGFDSAISKVCEKMEGPFIDEMSLMAREIRIGETRRQALRNLSDRVGSEGISSFSRSIIQAEELGTSLGRTLRVQAEDIRIKRQLDAEEKATKAPVKMLFPTVIFIFPAMFIVILGPAFLNIMATMADM